MKNLQSLKQKLFSKKVAMYLAAGMSLAAAQAQAAIDVTSVTTGIAEAGTALGLIIAALMAFSVTLFGVTKVYRFIARKAGA